MNLRLLIIDDDAGLNQMLAFHFEDKGYDVSSVHSLRDAADLLISEVPDLILLDQHLPDGNGIDILDQLTEADVPVIMMTGVHDLDLAIAAIKAGAQDFVHKPIKTEVLEHSVDKVLESRRLAREVAAARSQEDSLPSISGDLIGRCDAMLEVSKEIALSANSTANVLILGESGTGKEVVAQLIHTHSNREGPFVAVNCAAIVDNLLESELFGHEKGAFTGAVSRKAGKFELASEGTLFLDEIGELALPLQAKLLRVLQEGVFERVGGTQPIRTAARIVAATNRDLHHEVSEKNFREDLLYRLNVVTIELPPLRHRKEDIPLLAEALINKVARRIHRPVLNISDEAMARMMDYDWPGNVRELENILTQAMVHARSEVLTPDLLAIRGQAMVPTESGESPDETPLITLDELESRHIQRVLHHTNGHKGNTCDILGISRPALDRKIKRYDLLVPERH